MKFICYPKCSTCRKAKKWLDEHNVEYTERHIADEKPTYEELKDEEGAINYYKKAIENDKRYFDAYIEIAKIYMSKKEYTKALEILNEGEPEIDEIDEKKFQLLYLLTKAEVLFNLSKVDEAKTYYQKALDRFPELCCKR